MEHAARGGGREGREAGPSRTPRPRAPTRAVRAVRHCCKAGVLARHCRVAFIKQMPRLRSPRAGPATRCHASASGKRAIHSLALCKLSCATEARDGALGMDAAAMALGVEMER